MSGDLKISVIGAGSVYTPELAAGLIARFPVMPVRELDLMDIDTHKLEIVGGLVRRMFAKAGLPTRVTLTQDRRESIRRSDFVVVQARVGRIPGRIQDERIPAARGLIGQETNGAGGFAMAMRTIPLLWSVVEETLELAPGARVLDFMNPAGMITEAAVRHWERLTGYNAAEVAPPIIGLCNIPMKMKKFLAQRVGVPDQELRLQYLGLNHLSWVTKVWHQGQDVLPNVIAGLGATENLEGTGFLPDVSIIKALGLMPNQYLRYYYMTGEQLRAQQASTRMRGEVVAELEAQLLELYSQPELAEKPPQLERRGGAWYSEAAVSLIDALYNNRGEVHVVNVPNRGAIDGMAPGTVVEVPCVVGAEGATPIAQGALPECARGLVHTIKEYERMAIRALTEKSRTKAALALTLNPLVDSFHTADAMLTEMAAAHGDLWPAFE